MRRLVFGLALISLMTMGMGCTEVDDPDTRSVQQNIVTVDGSIITIAIEYDVTQVTNEEAAELLDSVVISNGTLDTNTWDGPIIPPADPGWATVAVPFDIIVTIDTDTTRVQDLEDMRWYWTERELINQWCPPGH